MPNVCFTGHRPPQIDGYNDVMSEKELFITKQLILVIKSAVEKGYDTFISGGAIGIDQMAAMAVLAVKEKFYTSIQLTIARPFPSQSSKWPAKSQQHYQYILDQADQVVDVSPDPYSPQKMQTRNIWMVDLSSLVIAVWNGGTGGTNNCINYAKSNTKPVMILNPDNLEAGWRIE